MYDQSYIFPLPAVHSHNPTSVTQVSLFAAGLTCMCSACLHGKHRAKSYPASYAGREQVQFPSALFYCTSCLHMLQQVLFAWRCRGSGTAPPWCMQLQWA